MLKSADIERRALDLVEQLLDLPDDDETQIALLAGEPLEVVERVTALRAALYESEAMLPTDFPGESVAAELAAPDQVGAFRVLRRIGAGGMGGVWLAERSDGLYDQKVAVKFIRPGLLNVAGGAFRTERRILARLEHPNIARLIDGGATAEGVPYLVMEYVDGAPIDEALAGKELKDRVGIFIKAADAVQFAHSRLVVHADLKPSNIFVDRQGRVKLLDFGIARLMEGEADAAGVALPMTTAYASPQRLAGKAPTTADDVFALGCILSDLVGNNDSDLLAISLKARTREEAERYTSVASLISDLDRWRERLPVKARRWTARYRINKFVARHRTGVMLTCVAIAALALLAGFATRSALVADQAKREAQARFEDARGAARLVSAELLTQLASRPGTFALRSKTVQAAQFYLDRLSSSPEAASEIRLEAALGLQRVAEAQGKPGSPNLGLTQQAYRNLKKALALLEPVNGDPARLLKVRLLLDLARLNSFARNDVAEAKADLAEAIRLLGHTDAKFSLLWAEYYVNLAVAQQWDSQYGQSIASAQRALDFVPLSQGRDPLVIRSMALDLLAEGRYYNGLEKASIAPYREALNLLLDYEKKHPGDQIINRRISRAQWALGSTLADFGDPQEAVSILTAGAERARAILRADPEDQDARRMMRIAENARGQAMAASGRLDEGISIIRQSIAERKAHLDLSPNDPMRMRDYMVAIKGLADTQLKFGRQGDACITYAQARQLIETIKERRQLTALDLTTAAKEVEERRVKQCAGAPPLLSIKS